MTLPRRPLNLLATLVALGVLAAVALPSATRADTTRATPDLLARWPLDEPNGPNLLDAVGGRVGTLVGSPILGAPTARADDRGAAITLLGTSAVALSIPSTRLVVNSEARLYTFSTCAWVVRAVE